jgi:hypothetical protein
MASSSSFYFLHLIIKLFVVANTQQINNLMTNSDSVNLDQLFHKLVHTFFNHLLQSEQLYTIISFIKLKIILIYYLLTIHYNSLSIRSKTKEYLVRYDDLLFGLVETWSRLSCSCLCFRKYHCNIIKK